MEHLTLPRRALSGVCDKTFYKFYTERSMGCFSSVFTQDRNYFDVIDVEKLATIKVEKKIITSLKRISSDFRICIGLEGSYSTQGHSDSDIRILVNSWQSNEI